MTRRSLRLKLVAVGLAGAAFLGACGDDDDDDATTDTTADVSVDTTGVDTTAVDAPAGGDADITIEGFAFTEATVAPGATVSIQNADSVPHTVTADSDDAFDSGQISGGSSGTITAPSEPGVYSYHCNVHSTMKGTLNVT